MDRPDELDGLCLAAALANDPHADAARDGLVPALREALAATLAARAAWPRRHRGDALARAARAVVPEVDPAAVLPPHAEALLAIDAPPSVRDAWAGAARMRPGFVAAPSLRATLRRLAGRASEPDATERAR